MKRTLRGASVVLAMVFIVTLVMWPRMSQSLRPAVVGALAGATVVLCLLTLLSSRAIENDITAQSGGQSTLSDVPLPGVRFDAGLRIQKTNRAFDESFAFPLDAPLSGLWHPDDWESDRLQLKDGAWQGVERRLFRADGAMIWAELTIESAVSQTLWIRDISRGKVAEVELAQTRVAIHDLYEVVAGGETDLNTKMRSLLAMGCRRFGVETGFLGQVQDNHLKVLYVHSSDDRIRAGQIYDVGVASGKVEKSPQPMLVQPKGPRGLVHVNSEIDWRDHPIFTSTERETYLGAPISVNGDLYGTLNFSDPEPRPPFAPEDTEFLQLMAQWLGGEIERRQARAELEKQQKQLLEVNQKLESMAVHDGLTGAKNRRAFDERLDLEFRRARRYGTPLSLILLDVDKFKHFNDTFGHPAGDEVLKRVAALLQEGVRQIDFMARYGGEEFVVLLPNTDTQGAQILAERLRASIEVATWKLREVTASFGVATLTPAMSEPTLLTSAADGALYEAKAGGRNRVATCGAPQVA